MAKRGIKRYINTSLWDDDYIRTMLIKNRDYVSFVLWQLFLTYPKSHISGIFQITIDHIHFYTGFSEHEIKSSIKKFERDNKIMFYNGWIGIKNFIPHQTPNSNMKKSIINGLLEAPVEIVRWVLENPDVDRELRSYPEDGYSQILGRIAHHDIREREIQERKELSRNNCEIKKLAVIS